MERAEGSDDLVRAGAIARSPLARDLDRGLVGLGARVAEKDARRKRKLDQAARELDLRLREVEVRRVDEGPGLCGDCAGDLWVGVTEQVDRDPGDQVEVFVAGVVEDKAALSAYERDRQAPAHLHQILVGELGRVHDWHGREAVLKGRVLFFIRPLTPTRPFWGTLSGSHNTAARRH